MSSFTLFQSAYRCTADRSSGDVAVLGERVPSSVVEVIRGLGGKTFEHGLYRVLQAEEVADATAVAKYAFPWLGENVVVFGYDWLGRQFAALFEGSPENIREVLLIEGGAGEVMVIPDDPIGFHNCVLLESAKEALARPFFESWQAQSPEPIRHDQCAGYKVPLFLGGADELHNLELSDLSVYWEMCAQMRRAVHG